MSETEDQAAIMEIVPPETVIYCGPTLPRQYALQQYHIFNGGLPAHVQDIIAKCPSISNLIVPVNELATTRIAISTQGSSQSSLYQTIIASFKGAK